MSENIPVKVSVWKKLTTGWGKVSELRTWTDLSFEPRFLQAGPWSIRMPYDAQAFQLGKTHLVTFDFRDTRMTGVIEKIGPRSDEDSGRPVLEASGSDALTLLGDAFCWPDPDSPINAQNVVRYYAQGAAETVLRNLIVANMITRRGEDMTVAASAGRGSSVVLNEEFTNLLEVVTKKCDAAGLGVRMGLVDTTSSTRAEMRLEFFTPVDRSNRVRLSQKVGTLRSWTQEDNAPTGTRAIIAAAKDETALVIGTVSLATNTLTIAGKDNPRHHLRTGSVIRFIGNGDPPGPLEKGKSYFSIRVDADTFKVALSRTHASRGTAINLTTVGTDTYRVIETTRLFRSVIDTAAESEWSRKRELFVSASISDDDDEATYTDLGNEALVAAAAQSAFGLETSEAEGMRYGNHYQIGDKVTVELLTGVSKVDTLRAVTLTASVDSGLTVSPVPGNPDGTNPLFGQAAVIRGIRRQVKALEREES